MGKNKIKYIILIVTILISTLFMFNTCNDSTIEPVKPIKKEIVKIDNNIKEHKKEIVNIKKRKLTKPQTIKVLERHVGDTIQSDSNSINLNDKQAEFIANELDASLIKDSVIIEHEKKDTLQDKVITIQGDTIKQKDKVIRKYKLTIVMTTIAFVAILILL